MKTIYDFSVKDRKGKDVSLKGMQGRKKYRWKYL